MKIVDNLYERYLKYIYIKQNRKKHVLLSKTGNVDRNCFFEGNNYVEGDMYGCKMGFGSYVRQNSVLRNVKIGRFCSIGDNVNMCLFEHPTNMVSTSPCFFRKKHTLMTFANENYYEDLKRDAEGYSITIGNDVWIGSGAYIKSGIVIGDGAVVGAGAVVTKDVEPYAIVGGIPAGVIRYRFSREQIECLLKSRWWEKDINWFQENAVHFKDIDEFMRCL